jgi:hypothetical protein
MDSILNSVKKALGLPPDYTAFDPELIMHINSALSTVTQLGVGPEEGFSIEDSDDTWSDFFEPDPRLDLVKTYVYLKVKLVFDPPANSFVVTSLEKQAEELGWRIAVVHDDISENIN